MEVPEHKEIRELARRFLSERGGTLRAYEEEEGFPWPLVEEMARLYRDARILTLYEGTSEVQKLIIGAHLTGMRAFA
ncbi:MAG: acyl-CoA dehydrogenase family protein [Thermus sp.]|uniref:acyl-CoA dehydrogenase family protein n=1 Tax=Thermus sp. TaxID=275 RepID=UPI003D0DEA66